MSVNTTTRTGTVSSAISQLAAALLSTQQQPITTLQSRLSSLNTRSSVLSTLKTRLLALHDEAQTLARAGTLSPFAAKAANVSDTSVLTASAGAGAASGAVAITVNQLARRATHVSDVLADTGTTISGGGTGTFNFTVTIAGTAYNASVTVNGGDTNNTVTDLLNGVTLTFKATSASPVTLKIQPDADAAVNEIKTFIGKYNDALSYLKQATVIDAKNSNFGPLSGDSHYVLLPAQLRAAGAAIVGSQAAGMPNSLTALGIQAGRDGTL